MMKVFFTSVVGRAIGIAAAVFAAAVGLNILFDTVIFPRVAAQTDRLLDSRINMIEQRFYGLESRLNRLELSSSRPVMTSPSPSDHTAEIQYLRGQVDSLRTRIGELECATLKLDERTLTAAAKARRPRPSTSEVCRQDTAETIKLSARP